MIHTQGTLHRRLSVFVDWVRTEPEREDEIRTRAENIRTAIAKKAREDSLDIRSTPSAGSFATRTGLRRHMRGKAEVEGQDVDIPFVVAPKTKDDQQIQTLLSRFEKYAREAYPDTERETTKSSVKLKFADKVNFDLVPLLATSDPERQILIRADGERRETSVQKHVEFIKSRNKKSNEMAGRVKFNEMVRLLKWWRCFRETNSTSLTDVPSFLINLLSAYAFDERGVQETYGGTLADWFGILARTVRSRSPIVFNDFVSAVPSPDGLWSVRDPVNPKNNIVGKWSNLMCDELAEWFEEGRDAMYDAIAAFDGGRDNDGVDYLITVLGTPFQHHSEI